MNLSLLFLRILFLILSNFFIITYMLSFSNSDYCSSAVIGAAIGTGLWLFLITLDFLFRKFNLRSFNIAIIGLFVGFLMGKALVLIFNAVVDISAMKISFELRTLEIIRISLYICGTYLGTAMTLKASDEFCISIPFVKFTPGAQKRKDLLVDYSALSDPRLIDLASTGILDHLMIVPRFLLKDLYAQVESKDETLRIKAKKSLEVIKKMESLPGLEVRFSETDFPDVDDIQGKLIRLARLLDTNILSGDLSRIQISTLEGIQVINLHTLSNALKPLTETGEHIKIKIQRYGKEPRQGIGYLEDGTMVVVNGGGRHLGNVIDAQVLSVKHTSSGRMVFCNACDEEGEMCDFEEGENL